MHHRLLAIALPLILSNLTTPLLAAVDTAVVGHLGAAHLLGGVSLGGLVFSFLYWGFSFLRLATGGLTAQASGAGNRQALADVAARGLMLAALLGLVIILLHDPLTRGMLALLGGSDAVRETALLYVSTRIWAAPAALCNLVVLGWLVGQQRARRALLLQVLINGSNAALAILFVFGFGWGVAGCAAATGLAEAMGAAAGLATVARLLDRRPDAKRVFDPAALKRLVLVNRDIFLRTACLLFAMGWFAHAGAASGDLILAANALLMTFQTIVSYGLDGFADASESLVGRAIGARDGDALRRTIRVSFLWAGATAAGFSALYALAGPAILRGLTDQADVREMALRYLPWAVLSPLLSVWSYQLDGIFVGATRVRELRDSMVLALVAFLGAAWLLVPRFGNDGLWAALMILMLARAATLGIMLPRIRVA